MSLLSPRPAAATAPRRAGLLPRPTAGPAMRELGLLTWLPVGVLSVLLAASLVVPGAVTALAVPVAVTGALLGIPHGAVDHLVPWWWSTRSGRSSRRRQVAWFAAAYAVVAAAALVLLLLAPSATFTGFLALSAAHFGRGEVAAWAERRGTTVPADRTAVLVAAAHGLAVVGLLVWGPRADVGLLGPVAPALAHGLDALRAPGLGLVAATCAAALAVLLRTGKHQEAGELALVLATFLLAPPLAAFGAYFGCWHALRHTGRLLDLARQQDPDAGWSRAVRRLAVAGAWPTTAALLAVAGLWLLRSTTSLQAEVSILLALTFPHAAVVWALDRRSAG